MILKKMKKWKIKTKRIYYRPVIIMIKDGLIFKDEATGKDVVFNYYTFYKMVIASIEKYTKKSAAEAKEIVDASFIVKNPPKTLLDVAHMTHEYEYHLAMILVYGEEYWNKYPDIKSTPPDEYFDWYEEYVEKNNLQEEILIDENEEE